MKTRHLLQASCIVGVLVAGLVGFGMTTTARSETTALVGATVHPVSGPAIEDAVLVMDGTTIVSVEASGSPPAGATIVDVSGLHVYPGMIDPNSVLGLVEISSVPGTRDISELGEINPNVRPEVAINPDSELLPVTMSNGVLTSMIAPRGGIIAGTAAVIRLEGWTWEDMTIQAPVGMLVNWPRMRIADTDNDKRRKKQIEQRDENMKLLRQAFADARAYQKALEAEGSRGIPQHDRDPRWEAMLPVLRKEIPVMISTRGDLEDLRAILRWTQEEDLDVVLIAGGDVWRVADELAQRDIPVILHQTQALPMRRWEPYDAPFTIAAKLHQAGVRFCFSYGSNGFAAAHARNLPYQAATAAAYGLPRDEALRGVTQSTAEILGVADRLGTLEVGKEATLIVTDGDPLEIRTQVLGAYMAGRKLDLDDRHKRLYEKYRARPRPGSNAEEAITERE
jgi:imidazolonepropionase-like amidohydrolase